MVTNARSVAVSGRKAEQKLYRHHTGFPGGLKEIPYKTMMENKPEEVRPVSPLLGARESLRRLLPTAILLLAC